MDDQTIWNRVVATADASYDRLSATARSRLDEHLSRIMQLKQDLYECSQAAGSSQICRECGGTCCLNGKFHVSVLDLLVYRSARVEPVVPHFENSPLCPYGGTAGCLMPPRFRSMTCLVFNCELVENRMDDREKERFAAGEHALRKAILGAEELLEYRAGRAVLLSGND
ncbi:MAG: hypothetical protein HXX11_09845 [Desulfuromonadales bacterium]|nr:hypothetical protein [Desulfuromonadales bacterium]